MGFLKDRTLIVLALILVIVLVSGCTSDSGPPMRNINNSMMPTIPPENVTVLGRLYDAGQPVTQFPYNGFILTGIVQKNNYTSATGFTYWMNNTAAVDLPFGNNSYTVEDAFTSGVFKEGKPFYFRFEKWNSTTHTPIRYESNKAYVYNGQPIDLDLTTDMHLVEPPYPEDASYLIGPMDNATKAFLYPSPYIPT